MFFEFRFSGKNSSPEPEGELSCNKKDDDEEEDDEEDDSNFEPNLMLDMPSGIKCNPHLGKMLIIFSIKQTKNKEIKIN